MCPVPLHSCHFYDSSDFEGYDIPIVQDSYLVQEEHHFVFVEENLWDVYAVSLVSFYKVQHVSQLPFFIAEGGCLFAQAEFIAFQAGQLGVDSLDLVV